jgi:hypothetical protein
VTTLHVHPLGDVIAHEMSDDCPCVPEQRPVTGGWLAVHHSLDGRETGEMEGHLNDGEDSRS